MKKIKKLAVTAAAALTMSTSLAPVIAQSSMQTADAMSYADFQAMNDALEAEEDERYARKAVRRAAGLAALGALGLYAANKYTKAKKHKDNHSFFHLKKKKVYLLLKNGKKAGKKYVIYRGNSTTTYSWAVPKRTYRVKGKKCYKVGKTRSGKNLYLPVKYTAYTHYYN